eukprot:gene16860-biopygen3820
MRAVGDMMRRAQHACRGQRCGLGYGAFAFTRLILWYPGNVCRGLFPSSPYAPSAGQAASSAFRATGAWGPSPGSNRSDFAEEQ